MLGLAVTLQEIPISLKQLAVSSSQVLSCASALALHHQDNPIAEIAAAETHSSVLTKAGKCSRNTYSVKELNCGHVPGLLVSFGYGRQGQLGTGSCANYHTPKTPA